MIQKTLRIYQQAYRGLESPIWLLAGVMLINRCGTMVLPYMTLYLTQYLHYSVTQTGIVMAIYGLGAFVGTFLGGRLTDRFGFYYVQLLSLLLSGAFLVLLQFVVNFYALCGSVFVFTLFGDAFRPANQSAIAHYATPETRTRALSLNRLAINLGWAVGGGLGGWLASFNYQLLFWADGLTCMLAGVFLWRFLPAPTHSNVVIRLTDNEFQNKPTVNNSPYRDTLFLGFVICNALYLIAFMQFFTIVPLFFKEVIRLNESTIGAIMALNGLLIVGVEMAMVYSVERRNILKTTLIIIGVTLAAVAYCILSLPGWALPVINRSVGLGIALGYVIVVTFSEMLVMPFLQSLTIERASHANRGQYLALYAMSAALAQTTAPALGSILVAEVGFSMHWLAMVGICLLSATGFGWLSKSYSRN